MPEADSVCIRGAMVPEEISRLLSALREPGEAECSARDAIRSLVERVNARAEGDILAGKPVTGAHHRAIEAELKAVLDGQ